MKEDNIKHILDLGVQLLNQKGYHNLGLKELLDSAGIPKGSFYYYFDSKEDFSQKVLKHYADNSRNYLSVCLKDPEKNPKERLITMFKEIAAEYVKADYKEGCLLGSFSSELANQNDSTAALLEAEFVAWTEVITQCIIEGQESELFNRSLNAQKTADFILNSWEGALVRMKAARSLEPFNLFLDYTINVVLK